MEVNGTATIAITRTREDANEFVRLATESGMEPVTLPTIRLVGRGENIAAEFLKVAKEHDPDYSIFMSSKAVGLLLEAGRKTGMEGELRLAIANTTVVAVGPKTREALEKEDLRVGLVPPSRFSSVGVGEVLSRAGAAGRKAVVPRSGAATPFLKELLLKMGMEVIEIPLYDLRAAADAPEWDGFEGMLTRREIDGMIFTSASSVRAFFEIMTARCEESALMKGLEASRVVAIGPFTADELEKFGVKNAVSQVHTVPGAFETLRGLL